jgi:Tfp pilus assembly protein PilX
LKRNAGFALVTTLLIAVVITILVFGVAMTGMIDRMVSRNQKSANSAYYVAQAGLQHYKLLVFRNLVEYDAGSRAGWCENPILSGIRNPETGEVLEPGDTSPAVNFGTGTYEVSLVVNDDYLVLKSVGEADGGTATVQLVASVGAGPSTAWENALFANGEAGSAKTINGHVGVHGSLHIVNGDAEIQEVTDFSVSGNAGIYNTYDYGGNQTDFFTQLNRVLPIPPSGTNATLDLCARVKVKRGNLVLDGNARMGTEAAPVRSLHLESGKHLYAKDVKLDDEEHANELGANVHVSHPSDGSLYSSYAPYDLEMPVLKDNYPHEVTGWFDAYSESGAIAAGCAWLFQDGVATLPPLNSTDGTQRVCGNGGNYISWKMTDGVPHFEIQGNVNLNGAALTFNTRQGSVKEIRYSGAGSLRLGSETPKIKAGKVQINTSLAPLGSSGSAKKFPENALGLVTNGDVEIDITSTDVPLVMLAYVAGTTSIKKQTHIVGSVVTDAFDISANVAHVMYHPAARQVAEDFCLPGSFCDQNDVPPNPGLLSDISIERR